MFGKIGNFIGDMFGKPRKLNHNFNFDVQSSAYNANPNLLASAGALGNLGSQFGNQYSQMVDPNSAFNQAQYAPSDRDWETKLKL